MLGLENVAASHAQRMVDKIVEMCLVAISNRGDVFILHSGVQKPSLDVRDHFGVLSPEGPGSEMPTSIFNPISRVSKVAVLLEKRVDRHKNSSSSLPRGQWTVRAAIEKRWRARE